MSGSQVVKDFYWTAPHATTVELYVAITNRDAQATDGYALVASVQGPSGVAGVPITCGAGTSYTIKILTMNAAGSAATHMWGGIGL
ncbi:hypothetical protein ACWEOH_08020 [Agromyces sp. NPDC004153]|nr:hypothetical protein [Agromyces mariniharenae]